ncbi:type II secretion system F family protein [Actinomadura vinacea]|uniref:type II secretion system F family protein n=1 Tax=Actinomadura vinacea TaxID=115336 RepID=UPI0031CF32A4
MLIMLAGLCMAGCGLLLASPTAPATRRLRRQLTPSRSRTPRLSRLRGGAPDQRPKALRAATGPDRTQHGSALIPNRRHLPRAGEAPTHPAEPTRSRPARERLRRRIAAVTIGVSCAVFLGGLIGITAGLLLGAAVYRSFTRAERAKRQKRQSRLAADLPVAVDLLAACLRGGTPWSQAAEAVAGAVGGPLGDELDHVAAQIRLGADPAAAWLALADDGTLAPLARTAVRALQSGAAPAAPLARLARDQRRNARTAAAKRARSAGVKALAPLGACFLPAFVLLGVVPAIAGIASTILLPR